MNTDNRIWQIEQMGLGRPIQTISVYGFTEGGVDAIGIDTNDLRTSWCVFQRDRIEPNLMTDIESLNNIAFRIEKVPKVF